MRIKEKPISQTRDIEIAQEQRNFRLKLAQQSQYSISNNEFHSTLRKLVVDFLEFSTKPVAQTFRAIGSHSLSVKSSSQELGVSQYLRKMRQNATWGGEPELAALGSLFNVNVVVLLPDDGLVTPYVAGEAADTVFLKLENGHYNPAHQDAGTALGDGNCLFRSFTRALWQMATGGAPRLPSHAESLVTAGHSRVTAAAPKPLPPKFTTALEYLKSAQPTDDQIQQEKHRISSLSPEEQEQIRSDRLLALQLSSFQW